VSESTGPLLARAEALLRGVELQDKPKALLAFNLCKMALILDPASAKRYWDKLCPLVDDVPLEMSAELTEMRAVMEPQGVADLKGFAADRLAEIHAAEAMAGDDPESAARQLQECEVLVERRKWPFDRATVWDALVRAWVGLDRKHALRLMHHLPTDLASALVARMNRAAGLTEEEWKIFASSKKHYDAVPAARKILLDQQSVLEIPDDLTKALAFSLTDDIVASCKSDDKGFEVVEPFGRLISLQLERGKRTVAHSIFRESFLAIAGDYGLNYAWMRRFQMLGVVLAAGVSSKVLSDVSSETLARAVPPYLGDFVRATYRGLTATSANLDTIHAALMGSTGNNLTAEAWFLVMVVLAGKCAPALELARRLSRADQLVPQVRRAWLCTNPESAPGAITAREMEGDPVGTFLVQGSVADRAAYLREITGGGNRGLPAAMWAGRGTEEHAQGLRGLWESLTAGKTLDQVVSEYVERNPLYGPYKVDTPQKQQFSEYVRVHGFGEYSHEILDKLLLETLLHWSDERPDEVKMLLRIAWLAITPDDEILKIDWLRNAILQRCRTVFAADPEVLIGGFIVWVKRELVDKGRSWKVGGAQLTLQLANTAPLMFAVLAAAGIDDHHAAKREEILTRAVRLFDADETSMEAVATVYSGNKTVFDLTVPFKIEESLLSAWQVGVVRNALAPLLVEMMLPDQPVKGGAPACETPSGDRSNMPESKGSSSEPNVAQVVCPVCSGEHVNAAAQDGENVQCNDCGVVFYVEHSDAGVQIQVQAVCPKCRSEYGVSPSDIGADAECEQCGAEFTVQARKGSVAD